MRLWYYIPYSTAVSWLQLATTRLCLYGLQTTQQQVNFLVVILQLWPTRVLWRSLMGLVSYSQTCSSRQQKFLSEYQAHLNPLHTGQWPPALWAACRLWRSWWRSNWQRTWKHGDVKDWSSSTACFISFRPLLLDWTLALPAGLLMGMSLQSVQLLDLHTHSILFECGKSWAKLL